MVNQRHHSAEHLVRAFRSLLGLAVLAGLTACGSRQTPEAPAGADAWAAGDAVARVGDRVIRLEELQAEADRRRAEGLPVGRAEDLLRERLRVEAVLLQARKEGLADDPAVRAELDRVLVRAFRSRSLVERLDRAEVSEDEVRAAYEAHREAFTRPAMDRLAVLTLEKEKAASTERLESLRARITEAREAAVEQLAGDPSASQRGFGALSLMHSDDQASRHRGGDYGWFRQDRSSPRLPDRVHTAARALEVGAVSHVLEEEGGLYVVMKTDHRPEQREPFDQVKTRLERNLLAEKRAALEAQFYEDCLARAGTEIRDEKLAGLVLEPARSAPSTGEGPPTMALMRPGQEP